MQARKALAGLLRPVASRRGGNHRLIFLLSLIRAMKARIQTRGGKIGLINGSVMARLAPRLAVETQSSFCLAQMLVSFPRLE